MLDASKIAPERVRPIRREEYDRLVTMGFFEGEKVELLYGSVVEMASQDPEHAFPVERLTELLVPRLVSRASVRIQLPFAASDESEPEPDVAIVPRADYRHEHPSAAFLIIEVARTSQTKDRNVKAGLYAESGVTEYWIVDVPAKTVEVYRDAAAGAYADVTSRQSGDELAPVQFPDVILKVDDLF
ncbi:Uma2 family endonuclease [soil metagenome]